MTFDLNTAVRAVVELRQRNADVFWMPSIQENFLYVHEELAELYRVAQRMFSPKHLRTNPLNMEIDPKKHLEWGQVFMMLATVAIQMNIDADRALEMAITHTDSKCEKKRDNRYGDVNKERIVRDEDK